MNDRRPALIFDFGNVVAFFDYARACVPFAARAGMTPETFLGSLRERGLTPLVQDFERGALTSGAFTQSLAALAGQDIPHDEFAAAWADIFRLNRPIADLVASLKGRGYRLVLGSNTNEIHARHFRRAFADTLDLFDGLVLSYELGHIKPSAEFYLACARAAGADPADCVFIDDLPENVEGARRAGLRGILYVDPADLAVRLRALGVEVELPQG